MSSGIWKSGRWRVYAGVLATLGVLAAGGLISIASPEQADPDFRPFASQRKALASVGRVLEVLDEELPHDEKAHRLAEQASLEQARMLGITLEPGPDRKSAPEWTSSQFTALLRERYGPEAQVTTGSFQTLPQSLRSALGEALSAYFAFEDAASQARQSVRGAAPLDEDRFAELFTPVLRTRLRLLEAAGELRKAVKAEGARGSALGSGGNSEEKADGGPAKMRLAQAPPESPAATEECYIGVHYPADELRAIDETVPNSLPDPAESPPPSPLPDPNPPPSPPADPASDAEDNVPESLRRHPLCINVDDADDTYINDYMLLIDAGGNDTYRNNGGGSATPDTVTPASAGALLDLGGGNDGYINSCERSGTEVDQRGLPAYSTEQCRDRGMNGGGGSERGTVSAGFLFDDGGDDTYVGGRLAINGGAGTSSAGFLFDAGGTDHYSAKGEGVNGGQKGGLGLLVDAGGNDTYSAPEGKGANGGSWTGHFAMLVDGNGNDAYSSGERGVNGGVLTQGQALLMDGDGDDHYTGKIEGVNGGSSSDVARNDGVTNRRSGLLFDRSGDDVYFAEGFGTNGGSYSGRAGSAGSGALVDQNGKDLYSAGAQGVNGGGTAATGAVAAGILIDAAGEGDEYADENPQCAASPTSECNGSGVDHSLAPKGTGAQMDTNQVPAVDPEIPPDIGTPTPIPSPTVLDELLDGLEGDLALVEDSVQNIQGQIETEVDYIEEEVPDSTDELPEDVTAPVDPPGVPEVPGIPSEGAGGRVLVTNHSLIPMSGTDGCTISPTRPRCSQEGARRFIKKAVEYVTGGKAPARLLFLPNAGIGLESQAQQEHVGMARAGFPRCSDALPGTTCYDYALNFEAWNPVTCKGTGSTSNPNWQQQSLKYPPDDRETICQGAKDSNVVRFEQYDAVIVSHQFAGDLWKLEDRRDALYEYVNSGHGLLFLDQNYEYGRNLCSSYGRCMNHRTSLPTSQAFCCNEFISRVLPFLTDYDNTRWPWDFPLRSSVVTPQGREIGLTDEDVGSEGPRGWFTESCGFDVMEVDDMQRIVTMGTTKKIPSPCSGVSVDPPAVKEGNSGTTPLTFRVSLNSTTTEAQSFEYETADGSATVADNDYVSTRGTLTFPAAAPRAAGSVVTGSPDHHDNPTRDVAVQVVGDAKIEPDETVLLRLTDSRNPQVRITAVGNIINDDGNAGGLPSPPDPPPGAGGPQFTSQANPPPQPAPPAGASVLTPGAAVGSAPALSQAAASSQAQAQASSQAQAQAQAQAASQAQASSSASMQVPVPQTAMMKERERQIEIERAPTGQDHVPQDLLASGRQAVPRTPMMLVALGTLVGMLSGISVKRRTQHSPLTESVAADREEIVLPAWLRRAQGKL